MITNPTGNDILPDLNYDINLGMLTKKYLTLHAAELWVETLVAQNTLATIGGRVLVAPTNMLSVDLNDAAGATTITVKYNNFANGEIVYMEADGKVEFMAIGSAPGGSAGAYTYQVTRNLDGTGRNLWYAGDALLNTGQAGNGFIDIYSVRGIKAGTEIGPTIVGNVRNSATYNDWITRWAIGNLDGLYGYSGTTYGAAFGAPAGAWLKIDPSNGIRIGHNVTTYTQIDAAGNASFAGTVTAGAGAIGGFNLGADYVRDAANSMGLASTVTGSDDVRFWAGNTFANRATAPFRVTEAGTVTATNGTITGQLYGKASNAATPALSFTEDTDSGIYWTVSPPSIGLSVNGTELGNFASGTFTSQMNMSILFAALGTGAATGRFVTIGGNSSGAGAAGTLSLGDKNGSAAHHLWIDAVGALRLGTARPEEDGTPSDTSGVIVAGATGNSSGTYTPTLTAGTNVVGATAYPCTSARTADAVMVSCYFDIDPTAAGTLSILDISLPIASNFTTTTDGAGSGGSGGAFPAQGGALLTNTVNDRMTYSFHASSAVNNGHAVSFMYRVQ